MEREELVGNAQQEWSFQSTMVRTASGCPGTVAARVVLRSTMIGGTQRARGRLADRAVLQSTMMQGAGGSHRTKITKEAGQNTTI